MEKYRLNRTLWYNEDSSVIEDVQIIENNKNLYPLFLKRGQVMHKRKLTEEEKKIFGQSTYAYFDNTETKGFSETEETKEWVNLYEK